MLIVRVTDGFPFYYPLEHNSVAAQMSSSHLLCSLYFSRRQFVLCRDLTSFNFNEMATDRGALGDFIFPCFFFTLKLF